MSKPVRNALIVLAVLVLVALGAAVVLHVSPFSPSGASTRVVDFIDREYPITDASGASVFGKPDEQSPVIAKVRQGVAIKVIGLIEGNRWVSVELPDKRQAFLLASTFGLGDSTATTVNAPATVEFIAHDAIFVCGVVSNVFAGPSTEAPVYYTLQPNVIFHAEAQSKDGKWVVSMTEDGRAAYIQQANLKVVSDHL